MIRLGQVSRAFLSRGRRSLLLLTIVGLFCAPFGHATIAAAQTPEVVFDLKIEKGKVAPNVRLIRVKQGDTVRLRWTTDRSIVLHLHGSTSRRRSRAPGGRFRKWSSRPARREGSRSKSMRERQGAPLVVATACARLRGSPALKVQVGSRGSEDPARASAIGIVLGLRFA